MSNNWVSVAYEVDDNGIICAPEVSDVLVTSVCFSDGLLIIEVCRERERFDWFRVSCKGVVACNLGNICMTNITMGFFVSSLSVPLGAIGEDILASLHSNNCSETTSHKNLLELITSGKYLLFGNEPSVGCEVALICSDVIVEIRNDPK